MRRIPGNDLMLGRVADNEADVLFPRGARSTHLYVCGATGTGKSKFLESLIRQDIKAWRKSGCGLLVLDPHGSLYDSLMRWLAWNQPHLDRPVVPIDLRRDDWVVAYNLMRQRKLADPQVIVDEFVQAMAYVWGESGTDRTPLFARWASNVIRTLYEKNLTLVEATHLISRMDKRMRQGMAGNLSDKAVVEDWQFANTLTPVQFDAQIGSTINRFRPFLGTQILRLMFGQSHASLDLDQAIEDGQIILVCLARGKNRVSEDNAALFATLLLSDLWAAASERGKPADGWDAKPFYVYIDEFQNFVTPTIAKNLDQARGFGLHLTLAHQFPQQLMHTGAHGKQVWNSIMVNARSKVVFGMSGDENLLPLAEEIFRNTIDPDKIKHELYSTKVMDYVEEYRTSYSQSSNTGSGGTHQSGGASGKGSGGTTQAPRNMFERRMRSRSTSEFASHSESHSDSWSESHSDSQSDAPMLIPVMGKELSSVQFESIDEQLWRAMAVLHDQEQRQCVAKLVGTRFPLSLFTPHIENMRSPPEMVASYTRKVLERWPFALRTEDALRQLTEREAKYTEAAVLSMVDEPATAKRRIR